jgi:hypothetical protein
MRSALLSVVVLAMFSTQASAFDISATSEVWNQTIAGPAGEDGVDKATGVAFDRGGHIYAAGTLDGEAGHGDDGYVASWNPNGTLRWDLTIDSGPAGVTDSIDRIDDMEIDTIDQVTVLGRLAANGVADGSFWARALVGGDGSQVWERTWIDGVSPEQEAFGGGISPANNDVFAVGWSRGDLPALTGRWDWGRFAAADGSDVFPPINFDASGEAFNPDQARDGAMDDFGDYVVVGRVGVDGGAVGSLTNDSQWMARSYDALGAVIWTKEEGGLLDDEATRVIFDSFGQIVVAGYTNVGTDNGPGRDDDWLVIAYSAFADLNGFGAPKWTYQYTSAPGASERATALTEDEDGNIMVAGSMVDSASGKLVWRVVQLSDTDGSQLDERIWPATASDSVPLAVVEEGGLAVVAGYQGNDNPDFEVSYLGSDLDGDGILDATDGCPTDPNKDDAGICGCNQSDQDSDGDGSLDCDDGCVGDPEKTEVGICGCGHSDADDDGDGVPGCHDACSNTAPGAAVDPVGCSDDQHYVIDTGTPEAPPPEPKGGCECDSGTVPASSAGLVWLAAAAVLSARRRR